MILSTHTQIGSQPYDLCIIGSGAMGIALASALADTGMRILILEAGDDAVTPASQEFYQCDPVGRPHNGASNGRFRVYGGSTERWGGQAMRFEPADFHARDGINAGDWPVSYDEILPYYATAESFMGVENPPYDELADQIDKLSATLGISTADLKQEFSPFKLHNSVFSHTPRLREMHATLLQDHPAISLLKKAAVTRIFTDNNGTITHLSCHVEGQDVAVRANEYVLATGGIENARFLLLQKDYYQIRELAGHQAIGCFFQDHPGAHIAEISGVGAALFQNAFRLKNNPNMSCKGRVTWSDETRIKKQLLSVSGTFLLSRQPSPFDDPSPDNTQSDWLLALKLLLKGVLYSPIHYTILAVSAEDARDKASRILLSEHKQDAFGQPRAMIDWKISPKVAQSILEYADYFEQMYKRMNFGRFRRFSIATDPDRLMARLEDNSHHNGSTSMGSSTDDGVVDKDLKVFGFNNFRIAGTSTLPTGSHANPSLTALALTFRLAEQLRHRARPS